MRSHCHVLCCFAVLRSTRVPLLCVALRLSIFRLSSQILRPFELFMDAWLGLNARSKGNSTKSVSCKENEPPSKKWKPEYETTRTQQGAGRETVARWLIKYKWLERSSSTKDEDNPTFICKWCKKAGKANRFSEGRTCQKADNLSKHEKTEDHRISALGAMSQGAAQTFEKAVANSKAKSEEAVVGAMKVIYFQSKENIATRKFKPLLELCTDLGATFLNDLKVADNAKHDSYHSIREMEDAISTVIEEELIDKINRSRWYSVSMDESTDVSTTQSVIVYIKLVNQGIICSHFLELKSLRGCTAAEIFECASKVLTKFGIRFDKISGLGTDGASNMTGHKKGVSALFKEKCKSIISVHCAAHRLALASSQAADSVLYMIKFQDVLNKVYKYFNNSPKNTATLKDVFSVLEMSERKFVRSCSTRWLTFYKSVSVLLESWPALVSVLLQDKSAVAQGLLKCISNYKFLATAAFLSDVLFLLNDLCYTFLKSNLDFTLVKLKVDCCMKELLVLSEEETGTQFMSFLDKVPTACNSTGQFDFQGHVVKDSEKLRDECAKARKGFMTALLSNLEERFEGLPAVDKFSFLLPSNLPNECDPRLSEYGVKEMKELCLFFSDNPEFSDEVAMVNEWKQFLRVLVTRCKGMKLLDCVSFFHVNSFIDLFPLMTSLFEFMATLPLSTVDCERGFSLMNLTKSDIRNRLTIENLNVIMMINLEGPTRDQFDFKKAFVKWCAVKHRRL